ncbi:endophilin-B1-like isoform X3 [Oppia nitens]|uniref:endophilin-B1-like isoform X3 n=1 Tax=Oppia nitens TaxID=1686743 RepID=UPI0023DBE90A|nr:endophilin-B1-like isoform X3 [Oppia nitens]
MMDFSAKSLKGLVSDVGTVFTRAKQYAEETIGTAEKTELDAQFESLADRADRTKLWTERIVSKTEAVLQPNPNTRYGDMIFDKIGPLKGERTRNLEALGTDMIDAGVEYGPGTVYGSALIKVGKAQQSLGGTEREFVANSDRNFVQPLRKFLDEDMRTITKERKILETKRLDLDAAKNRLRKAKTLESQTNSKLKPEMIAKEIDQAEHELRLAQEDFDRQIEITRLLLEGISAAHSNHVRCLNDFVTAQIAFYARCNQHMCDLQRELQSPGSALSSIRGQVNDLTSPSDEIKPSLPLGKRYAKALYDYESKDSSELSLMANEVIIVSHSSNLDTDVMIGERGFQLIIN